MVSTSSPLILTLQLDSATFERMNELRQQHFPPARNVLPAHVTLFHALPGDQEASIRQLLQTCCSTVPRLSLQFPTLRFLGAGVAVEVHCPELVQLRQQLSATWSGWLTPQDRQGYRPHITIQNKVAPEEARQLYQHLSEQWERSTGWGEGLLLWHYQGGPWSLADAFSFLP